MPAASKAARRAPLAGRRATAGDLVTFGQAPPRGQIGLRGDPAMAKFGKRVADAIGLSLPTKPNTTAVAEGASALWLGPYEWLILTPPDHQDRLARDLRCVLEDGHAAVVDLTDARAVIRISGAKAGELLAKGCPLDLHPRTFAAGACAQSVLAKASIILHGINAEGTFEVYVDRSYAEYMWAWLEDAALEYRR